MRADAGAPQGAALHLRLTRCAERTRVLPCCVAALRFALLRLTVARLQVRVPARPR
jgi:hypothetical protein